MEDLDMIYNMNDGKIMAGGYSINSILLNDQQPAMYQKEGGKNKHDKVSDRFKNLAVPAGLLYINESVSNNEPINNESINNEPINNDKIINDDLYERLLYLAGPESPKSERETPKKQTRSKKGKNNKKKMTKKNNKNRK
jgi:hypothetical protein